MLRQSQATVLFSGGMDSLIHLYWANRKFNGNVDALFVKLDHRYQKKELEQASQFCTELGIDLKIRSLPLSDVEDKFNHILLRNLFLLELASFYSDNIVFGMLSGEYTLDKRPGFVRRMNSLLSEQYARSIRILTPFSNYTKSRMLRWYLSQGGSPNQVYRTVGCYSTSSLHCGQCASCWNRWVALTNNGLAEKYDYSVWEWGLSQLGKSEGSAIRVSPGYFLHKINYATETYKALKTVYSEPLKEIYLAMRGRA